MVGVTHIHHPDSRGDVFRCCKWIGGTDHYLIPKGLGVGERGAENLVDEVHPALLTLHLVSLRRRIPSGLGRGRLADVLERLVLNCKLNIVDLHDVRVKHGRSKH